MIYCVVPEPLADELFEKLQAHYADDPNVEVIVDRRSGPDRRGDRSGGGKRERRDRRRSRLAGTFLPLGPSS